MRKTIMYRVEDELKPLLKQHGLVIGHHHGCNDCSDFYVGKMKLWIFPFYFASVQVTNNKRGATENCVTIVGGYEEEAKIIVSCIQQVFDYNPEIVVDCNPWGNDW